MILLDTNVVIYASDASSPFYDWALEVITSAVSTDGAGLNTVSLAELCVGASDSTNIIPTLRQWGIVLLDVPVVASEEAARAYREYRTRAGKTTPAMPLPDFFIGAHAQVMNWELATADKGRFRTYFPQLGLRMPPGMG
ncbi:MAG: type II toxin-antitoxin system VapC family toxin [Puniceicoccaceae bacterium]